MEAPLWHITTVYSATNRLRIFRIGLTFLRVVSSQNAIAEKIRVKFQFVYFGFHDYVWEISSRERENIFNSKLWFVACETCGGKLFVSRNCLISWMNLIDLVIKLQFTLWSFNKYRRKFHAIANEWEGNVWYQSIEKCLTSI